MVQRWNLNAEFTFANMITTVIITIIIRDLLFSYEMNKSILTEFALLVKNLNDLLNILRSVDMVLGLEKNWHLVHGTGIHEIVLRFVAYPHIGTVSKPLFQILLDKPRPIKSRTHLHPFKLQVMCKLSVELVW